MRTPMVRGRLLRGSPLRRRSDAVEAWTALVVAVLVAVGAPLVGVVAARWAYVDARTAAAEQRAERQRVAVEVTGRATDARPATLERGHAYRATVRWTDPDGGVREAEARVPATAGAGDRVHVWFDSRGRNVPPPVDAATAWQHAVGVGGFAAGGAAAAVLVVHAAVRSAAMRRRLAEWERDWARTGPEWTRRGV
ncbi:DUF3592 domain-containing protein [Streptomyces sp. NPDC029526]|uniref:Rv1733c family protein n=1 Tax=Streptomyces sp. NPDC029526 TaxID=3155728 RepID=UPI0033CE7FC8